VPERDDGHLYARRTLLADVVLRFGQQRTAQPFGLTTRVDRQHPQMPCRRVVGGLEQDAPRELRTLVVAHQQHGAVSRSESHCKRGRICPRSGKQPDLVGPAGTLAPVRGIDQRDDIADVGISGGHHDHVSTAG
jgi:hypothetical protein